MSSDVRFAPVPARGHRIRYARAGGFVFSESRHRDNVSRHAHENAMIVIGLAGAFEETYTGRLKPATCTAGTLLVRPAGEPHSNRFGSTGASDLAIEIETAIVDRLHPPSRALESVGSWREGRVVAVGRRIRAELAMADSARLLALEALGFEMLAVTSRARDEHAGDGSPRWLLRVRELVHDRWRDRAVTLTDLAEVAGVHPVHLARVYRTRFGETPAETIRRRRLEWAVAQICVSRSRLSQIALDAGYADQSHFTREFRKAYGHTPRGWRMLHGK